jgi:hypothetical protein
MNVKASTVEYNTDKELHHITVQLSYTNHLTQHGHFFVSHDKR